MPIDPVPSTIRALLADTRIQAALDYLKDDHDRTIAELKEMVLVHGAPHTEPEVRSPMYRDKLARYGLEDCFIDEVGNAFGYVRGAGARPKILAEAHLDTVFPADTPLAVQEKDGVLHCPGIADDTAALAAQLSIIRAIRHAGLVPCGTFMMGGTVGEEAPGEARGVRRSWPRRPIWMPIWPWKAVTCLISSPALWPANVRKSSSPGRAGTVGATSAWPRPSTPWAEPSPASQICIPSPRPKPPITWGWCPAAHR